MSISLLLIQGFLKGKGADKLPHIKGGSLLDHLVRTSELMETWGLDAEVQKVALCHSIYSTSSYTQVLVPENERSDVQLVIGKDAEKMVFYFSRLDRTSLTADGQGAYSFMDRITGEPISITEQQFRTLLHVLIANQLDHMDVTNMESVVAQCNQFAQHQTHIQKSAWEFLVSLGVQSELHTKGTNLRFVGHAGIWLSSEKFSLVVDPWIYSSDFSTPILTGIFPGQRTIDYLVPRPVFTTADIAPDIILLSHFLTHHAPLRDFSEFAKLKPVHIVCPPIPSEVLIRIRETMGEDIFSKITFHFCEKDMVLERFGVTVQAFTHTQKNHLAYQVKYSGISFMHIADGAPNSDPQKIALGSEWDKFTNTKPTYLFIGAANHSTKKMHGLTRDILEHTTLSPVQAAKLAVKIGSKNVALIGMYNFSIWDSSVEYTHSPSETEDEFAWALTYLAPNIKKYFLRPGQSLPF